MTKKMTPEDIAAAADELELFINNTEWIYSTYTIPTMRRLLKAKLADRFSKTGALTRFRTIADLAAVAYKQEIGSCRQGPFTAGVRKRVAEVMCADFEESAIRGELAWLI